MRIKGEKVAIEYDKTKEFFHERAKKYNEEYPYVVTMYQDNNPQLTEKRNNEETAKIIPFLELDENSRVLDIACGVGRWADSIDAKIHSYLGVDFSDDLIQIAKKRNKKDNFLYNCVSATEFAEHYKNNNIKPFNRVIIAGLLMYLNDEDVDKIFEYLPEITENGTVFYLREPSGIHERLTLKDFYSEELQHDYNTIYRAKDEYKALITEKLKDFDIINEGYLFEEPNLNNRKETSQYYFILQKKR